MRLTRGRILVIRGGAIGDFILTLPALAALRAQFPDVHLEVLGYPHIAQLAQLGGVVDRVQPIEARGLAGFFAAGGRLDPATSDYFARFDIILSYLFDPDLVFQTNVAQCSRAQFIKGPHRPNEAEGLHATRVYLKPLERLAIFDADPVPRIGMAEALHVTGTRPGQERRTRDSCVTIALHPGSGSEQKNWAESNWIQLLEQLGAGTRADLLIVGGEAEGGRLDRLAEVAPAGRVQIARSLPLTELASRLSECAAFIGHDSGITHLAAAVGLPVLVLWGGTSEEIWRPQGERVTVLRHPGGLARLPVERVRLSLMELLPP